MSGLAVIVGLNATEASVRKMLEAAPHRGDVTSVLVTGGVAAAIQGRIGEDPFVSAFLYREGGLLLACCGCLYRGSSIVTGTAAGQAVLDAYRRGGTNSLERLTGSFAAVVRDEAAGHTIAIRTPVGERPLFWRREGPTLLFGCEPKQLVAGALPEPDVDVDALLDLVADPFAAGVETTAYKGISRVPPGARMRWSREQLEQHRFWQPSRAIGTARLSVDDAVEGFTYHLGRAVERRLRAGTGLLLSGGLDSSAVAWAASPLHTERFGGPLRVVSAGYPDHPDVDETRYIELTVGALGLEPIWIYPKPRPFEDLDTHAWLHDGPEFAPMASNGRQLFSLAREHGITTLLDGHDGDTVLGASRAVTHELLRRGRLITFARHVGFRRLQRNMSWTATVRFILVSGLVPFVPKLRSLVRRSGSVDSAPAWTVEPLRKRLLVQAPHRSWERHRAYVIQTVLPLVIEHIERLALWERTTVLHPFCDAELVDYLASLHPRCVYATGANKALVRLGCGQLPEEVLRRTDKTRFTAAAYAGSPVESVLEAIRPEGLRLPGVDSSALRADLIRSGLRNSERYVLQRIISADMFLDRRSSHGSSNSERGQG